MPQTDAVASDRRRAIADLLMQANEPKPIADIAALVGVHGNTVRFHLDALIADGLAERVEGVADGPGRPPVRYRGIRRMDPAGPRNYQLLAKVLAGLLSEFSGAGEAAFRAGQSWGAEAIGSVPANDAGSTQPEVDRLVGLLDDMGFQPHTGEGATSTIELRHCPFLEIAQDRRDIICPVHLGLMQGALARLDAPTAVERLEPFAQPDRCVAHLGWDA